MRELILAINPGSTSTKAALYRGEECVCAREIHHTLQELAVYPSVRAQAPLRRDCVLGLLREVGTPPECLCAVTAIGGILPPVEGGTYHVNEAMVDYLTHRTHVDHASNLGALVGHEIARPLGIPAYICDPVTTDELAPVARLSGLPELPRVSTFHALNIRATARRVAQEKLEKPLEACNLIVGHLGGGISFAALKGGRAVDLVLDDEGAFSPVRSGGLPASDLVSYCYGGDWPDRDTAYGRVRGSGGMKAYLGTTDIREIQRRAAEGDEGAALVLEAYTYQAAKSLAQLAAVFCGRVDAMILTGGVARSEELMGEIARRVEFIAPVHVVPGEMEMEALASAALRVLRGQEQAREFTL